MGTNDDLSMDLTKKKLDNSIEAGAAFLSSACPYSQIQFDTVQDMILMENKEREGIGSILYSQLLGLSMGIGEKKLGLKTNKIDISDIKGYLSEE